MLRELDVGYILCHMTSQVGTILTLIHPAMFNVSGLTVFPGYCFFVFFFFLVFGVDACV